MVVRQTEVLPVFGNPLKIQQPGHLLSWNLLGIKSPKMRKTIMEQDIVSTQSIQADRRGLVPTNNEHRGLMNLTHCPVLRPPGGKMRK